MYGFFCRRLVLVRASTNSYSSVLQDLGTIHLIQNARLSSTGVEEVTNTKKPKDYSFTVSYLINTCGLSHETAEFVAQKVKLRSRERPDSVLESLKSHGFSNTQIAKVVRTRPRLLLADPERSVLPKLEFLNSIGVTDAELANVFSSSPSILCQSLEKMLIPNYHFLKSLLLSDEKVVKAFRKKSRIFNLDLQKHVAPKLAVLRELGTPRSLIALLLGCYSPIVLQSSNKFNENIKKVMELGFDPQKCGFIHAMQVFASILEPTRERKLDVLRRWGWSDEDIKSAFRRCPGYMNASEKKIISALDFLVNKMGWRSTDVASYPDTFLMNLENRVTPRCLVIKVLQSKGLVKKNLTLSQLLRPDEKNFLDRFVTKYADYIPQLVDIYQRKEGLEALDLNNNVSSPWSTFKTK